MLKALKSSKFYYMLWLLIFPPMTIELLSGSTPPRLYFNAITILSFTICYGMVFVLIRELKVRWKLSWQFILLLPIIGIFIEGTFMQSFFNLGHIDLGHLSNFGVFLGVQWPWTIYLVIMHAIYSIVIPLFITDIIFPNWKHTPILTQKSSIVFILFIIALTILQLFLIGYKVIPMYSDYNFDIVGNIACLFIMGSLILIAYLTRNKQLKKIETTKKVNIFRHFHGFIYMILLLLATHFFAEINIFLVIISQLILTVVLLRYVINKIYRPQLTAKELLPIFNGTIVFFSLFAVLQGLNIVENPDSTYGMEYVGYFFILATILVNIKGIYINKSN